MQACANRRTCFEQTLPEDCENFFCYWRRFWQQIAFSPNLCDATIWRRDATDLIE
jgi:hypothetical protein